MPDKLPPWITPSTKNVNSYCGFPLKTCRDLHAILMHICRFYWYLEHQACFVCIDVICCYSFEKCKCDVSYLSMWFGSLLMCSDEQVIHLCNARMDAKFFVCTILLPLMSKGVLLITWGENWKIDNFKCKVRIPHKIYEKKKKFMNGTQVFSCFLSPCQYFFLFVIIEALY